MALSNKMFAKILDKIDALEYASSQTGKWKPGGPGRIPHWFKRLQESEPVAAAFPIQDNLLSHDETKLDLSHMEFDVTFVPTIMKRIESMNDTVEECIFDYSSCGTNMFWLNFSQIKFPKLRQIVIKSSGMKDEAMNHFTNGIVGDNFPQLDVLVLNSNHISDAAMIPWISAAQKLRISQLYISDNKLTHTTAHALFESTWPHLEELWLNKNPLGENFKFNFESSKFPKLHLLHLHAVGIGNATLARIVENMHELNNLKILHLGDNAFTSESLAYFFKSIQASHLHNLAFLNFSGSIAPPIEEIESCLLLQKRLPRLRRLILPGKSIESWQEKSRDTPIVTIFSGDY